MFSIYDYELADAGFYINLDESKDRLTLVQNQIQKFKIKNLERFSALTDELRQSACTKSHKGVFQYALSNNLNRVFVAEDDFKIVDNAKLGRFGSIQTQEYLEHIYKDIAEYDVVMFGCNPKKQIIPINSRLGYNVASTGAWAYIINDRAMRYILDNYNYYKDYMAIDDILPTLNYKGFKTVVTIPQIITHADGIPSTLQPSVGDTYYSGWIDGSWDKHMYENIPNKIKSKQEFAEHLEQNYILEKNLTVLITGHATVNWLYYLRYLLKSLPKELFKCRFIVCYDSFSNDDKFNLSRYFRDIRGDIHPSIEYVNGGLISSLKKGLYTIQTPYFIWLEHDWVFLNDSVNWIKLIDTMNNYSFINSIWLNKDDNNIRGFEICNTENGVTPFERETRVSDMDLITTCRWSNNPAIHRTSKMKEWFENYIDNEHVDKVNQRSHNIEEKMIDLYRKDIINHGWLNVKDNWGTYLYGKIGDAAYVGHTDASGRYGGISRSQPEINGSAYIHNNPLTEND
jgi:GR25 family glycosyltransferase involved in LPS biosynthesis